MSARNLVRSRTHGRTESRKLRFEPLEGRRLLAVDFHLLADVNQTPEPIGSSISKFVTVGGTAFFTANDGISGQELWKSDGTPEGTVRVKDIFPGHKGSYPAYLTEFQGVLYFTASDRPDDTTFFNNDDVELWRSDGTGAGTYRVKDLVSGARGSGVRKLANAGGTLFFSALADVPGSVSFLWKSDGTEAGTEIIVPPQGAELPTSPDIIGVVGNILLFGKDYDLWRSDGTGAGTYRLLDLNSYEYDEMPKVLVSDGETAYFSGNDGVSGFGLWKTDGTIEGTFFVSNGISKHTYSSASAAGSLGDRIVFAARDSQHGEELWVSDGTAAGTMLLMDILPDVQTSPYDLDTYPRSSAPYGFTNVNGVVYFLATYDGGTGLWRTDGTVAGTVLVKNVTLGYASTPLATLANVDGTLYFSAHFGSESEPWKTDGTEAGTVLVKDIVPGVGASSPLHFTALNGNVLFAAAHPIHGHELWRTDGTEAGTVMIKDILPATAGSAPAYATDVAGSIFFKANDGANGEELWISDGDASPARLVKDIRQGLGSSQISNLTEVGETLFFTANDGSYGVELWKSDGTAAGTTLVRDIAVGVGGSNPNSFVNVNGTLYFLANDGATGAELWMSDGTEAGTVCVKDVAPGLASSHPSGLAEMGGVLYFVADDGATGRELWRTDGSAAGTTKVKDIWAGAGGSVISPLANVGGVLYFSANDGSSGVALWKSDGTSEGTVRVKTIPSGPNGDSPGGFVNVNGELYFSSSYDRSSMQLWKSDGTEAGTTAGPAFSLGSGNLSAVAIGNAGNKLFVVAKFFYSDEVMLWSVDVATGETKQLIFMAPIGNFTFWGEHLYFTRSSSYGTALWRTDGTQSGTELVREFSRYANSGVVGSGLLKVINDRLVVTVKSDRYGAELWISDLPTTPLAGDYDDNGQVDGGDFLAWQRGFGGSATPAGSGADGDASGAVDAADLAIWKEQFGAGMVSETVPLFAPQDAAFAGLRELGMQVDDAIVQVELNQAASLAVHDFHDYAALAQAAAAADSSATEPRDRGGKNLLAKKNALAVAAAGEGEARQDAALSLLAYDSCADAGDWRAADLSDELPATRSSLRRTDSSAGERRRGSAFESLLAGVN